jgi:hypothetical protein
MADEKTLNTYNVDFDKVGVDRNDPEQGIVDASFAVAAHTAEEAISGSRDQFNLKPEEWELTNVSKRRRRRRGAVYAYGKGVGPVDPAGATIPAGTGQAPA